MPPAADYTFASDNTAGICPEALAALQAANAGRVVSYGDDPLTAQAKRRFAEVFEAECDVFFVFNGTAANSLALASICRSHHSIFCHEQAHVDVDECGAPGFFTGGAKLTALSGSVDKLEVAPIERALQRGHGVHSPLAAALSLTQSTELGTVYTPAETRALADFAHAHGMKVQVDGARFANAVAALETKGCSPADLTWKSGVDILCFGGTKNGMNSTEAVVIFDRLLAADFDRRVKQTGQLASKMRFAAAQWDAMLGSGAWLRNARTSNARARQLADGLKAIPGLRLLHEPEANGVFVTLPPAVFAALEARGWHFYKFLGDDVYRLMCAWDTTAAEVDAFVADARRVITATT
jgi:threonine aldolase